MKSNLNYLKKMSKVSLSQNKAFSAKADELAAIKSKTENDKDNNEGGFTEEDFKMFEKSYFNH
jgi:hypothetical protein